MKKYILNVDGDELLYNCAFSVEKTGYKLITQKGEYNLGTMKKERIIQFAEGKGEYKLLPYKLVTGPAYHAKANLKRKLAILDAIGEVKLWLSSDDKSNFRYGVAKTSGPNGKGYKAGRPSRPTYYNDCREYLLKRGAEEIKGYEADDALGIYMDDNSVAVHRDKDINRVAGKHLNWFTQERYVVTQPGEIGLTITNGNKKKLVGYGNAYFFAQMLLGDRVDNIPSCGKGMGDVKVAKLLLDCREEVDYYHIIKEQYQNTYEENWQEVMYEIADLLYILDNERITGSEYLKRFE